MINRLSLELLCFIGCKLDSAGDRIRFRAVSKSWRSALPFGQPPWLMIHSASPDLLEIISAGEQTSFAIDMPEFHRPEGTLVVGCTGDWVITSTMSLPSNEPLHLLNPLTTAPQFRLPPRLGLADETYPFQCIILKAVLSSYPPKPSGDVIAMGVFLDLVGSKLAVAKPGDESWTALEGCPGVNPTNYFEDCVFYDQQFYAISKEGELVIYSIGDGAVELPKLSLLSSCFLCGRSDDKPFSGRKLYLVELSGMLLMVDRFLDEDFSDANQPENYRTRAFKIYKFDFVKTMFDELNCLGDHSLFLGINTSVSVLASEYLGLVKRNCVYFADDMVSVKVTDDGIYVPTQTKNDVGVFDLEDNSIAPHYKGTSTSSRTKAVWVIPA